MTLPRSCWGEINFWSLWFQSYTFKSENWIDLGFILFSSSLFIISSKSSSSISNIINCYFDNLKSRYQKLIVVNLARVTKETVIHRLTQLSTFKCVELRIRLYPRSHKQFLPCSISYSDVYSSGPQACVSGWVYRPTTI